MSPEKTNEYFSKSIYNFLKMYFVIGLRLILNKIY